MNKEEAQSFEVAPYSDVEFGVKEAHQVIIQAMKDLVRDSPAHAVWADWTGDKLKVHYHTSVVNLPAHVQQTSEQAHEIFKQTVNYLKKEFKDRTGKALKLKEDKELAGDTVEKVSLNARYFYRAWRFYDVSW